jgi:non-heme chloroperoxidase
MRLRASLVVADIRANVLADRSSLWMDLRLQRAFYGYNRPVAKVSEEVCESFWLQGIMTGGCTLPIRIPSTKCFSPSSFGEHGRLLREPLN